MNATQQGNDQLFIISREFDAPRERLWSAVTEPDRMRQWWGPKGVKVVKSEMDLRPGGHYLYGMETPDGAVMWGKMVYRDIEAPRRLVFINCFSDEHGGVTRHPMSPTWPLELLSTFIFDEISADRARFTIRWEPLNATPDERAAFAAGHDSMRGGWGGTLDQLAAYLATAR